VPDIPLAASFQVNDVPSILPEVSKYVVSLSEAENFFTKTLVSPAVVESNNAVGTPAVSDIFGRLPVFVSTFSTTQSAL
jgi:hypothetical protein